MTLADSVTDAYLIATGKSPAPLVGSSKYNRLFGLGVKFYRDWCREKGTDWNSLYQTISAGTVSATDTFDFETEVIKVSQRKGDYVLITCTDGNVIPFKTVHASKLRDDRYSNACAKIGQTLRFSRTFTSTDQEFGGTISVPAYVMLDDLTSASDDILIDNPQWLSVIMAAQYVESDAQLSYKYPDLVAQATEIMDAMKLENNPQDDSYASDENYFTNGLGDTEC